MRDKREVGPFLTSTLNHIADTSKKLSKVLGLVQSPTTSAVTSTTTLARRMSLVGLTVDFVIEL
jgi:uncharacterized membrane protein